jgi:hypothetical protein
MNRSDPRPARYRPGPLRWFCYAVGGRLPDRYRPWVLHDLTCRTWPLRHLARLVAQLAPVAIVLVLLLPGPLWIRVVGALGGSLVGLFYSLVFLYEATEGRAAKAATPTARCTRSGTSARPSAPSSKPPPTSTAPGTTSDTTCGLGTDFYIEIFYIEMPSPQTRTRQHHAGHVVSRREVRLAPARPPGCMGQPQVRPRDSSLVGVGRLRTELAARTAHSARRPELRRPGARGRLPLAISCVALEPGRTNRRR